MFFAAWRKDKDLILQWLWFLIYLSSVYLWNMIQDAEEYKYLLLVNDKQNNYESF